MEQIFPSKNNFKTLQQNCGNQDTCLNLHERKDHHFQSAGSAVLVQPRCWWPLQGHLSGWFSFFQVLFCKAAFWLFSFQAILLHGVIPAQGFALPFELHRTAVGPFLTSLRHFWVSWQLFDVWICSQFSVMCKAAETSLCAISQVIDKDVKYHWSSELTTAGWPGCDAPDRVLWARLVSFQATSWSLSLSCASSVHMRMGCERFIKSPTTNGVDTSALVSYCS